MEERIHIYQTQNSRKYLVVNTENEISTIQIKIGTPLHNNWYSSKNHILKFNFISGDTINCLYEVVDLGKIEEKELFNVHGTRSDMYAIPNLEENSCVDLDNGIYRVKNKRVEKIIKVCEHVIYNPTNNELLQHYIMKNEDMFEKLM